MNMRCL